MTKNLSINIDQDDIVNNSILNQYPQFTQYQGPGLDNIVRYIALMYDSKSALIKKHPILKNRKDAALKQAGFTQDEKGRWHLEDRLSSFFVSEMMSLVNEAFLKMVLCYRRKIDPNRAMDLIVSNEQVFEEYQEILMTPLTPDRNKSEKDYIEAANKKKALMDQSDEINERLKKYYLEAYADDEELVEKSIEFDKAITPESMAKRS